MICLNIAKIGYSVHFRGHFSIKYVYFSFFFDINQKRTKNRHILSKSVTENEQNILSLQRLNKSQQVMNDLIKVNSENQNQAIDRCQQILNERREALASKARRRD